MVYCQINVKPADVALFFVSALIYNAFVKGKGDKSGGITLGGKEKITEMIESDMVSEILIDSAVAERNGSS